MAVYEPDPELLAKHQAFKRLVDAEQIRTTFRGPDDLKFEVATALFEHAKRYGLVGTRGSAFLTPSQFFKRYQETSAIRSTMSRRVPQSHEYDCLCPSSSRCVPLRPVASRSG